MKPTLEVIIPAHNEEANIGELINSVYAQRSKNFRLTKVTVYCDDCTDKTFEIVKTLQSSFPTLYLVKNKKRLGKYYTLGQAFARSTARVIAVLDGDLHFVGSTVLDKLALTMSNNPKLNLLSANEIELRPSTFEGRLVYSAFSAWDMVRLTLSDDNPWHYHGTATLYRGIFARRLHLPSGLLDPHLYIYLMATQLGCFRLCRTAYIRKWSISTLNDYFKFMRRTLGKPDPKLRLLFGAGVDAIYVVPLINKLRGFFVEIKTRPFFGPLGILLSFFMSRYAITHANSTVVWDIVKSTKKRAR